MINVGLVGYGYWGPNLARNFAEADGIKLGAVCDARAERLALVEKRYPGIKLFQGWQEMVDDPLIDMVAVSTPVLTHFAIGMAALRAGKHLLVEKPMAMNVDECARLIDEAARRKLVLMVDQTFVYTPAVRKMRSEEHTSELQSLRHL